MDVTYEERIKKVRDVLKIYDDDLFKSIRSVINILSKMFEDVLNSFKEFMFNLEFEEETKHKPILELKPNKILILDKTVRCYHLKSNC